MRRPALLLVPLLALLLVGCGTRGPAGVHVRGSLVRNGKPLSPPPKDDDTFEVTLHPDDAAQTPVAGTYHAADGRFEFHGPTGGGVPPGAYRVLLRWVPYEGEQEDRFRDQFNPAATPFHYTVTDEPEQEFVLDVGKRTVAKK